MQEFPRMQERLLARISWCITSPHFQVAERTLFLWNNDYIVRLINQSRQAIFPTIIPALYRNSEQHWHSAVRDLSFNVLKLLMEADPELSTNARRSIARKKAWTRLQRMSEIASGKPYGIILKRQNDEGS